MTDSITILYSPFPTIEAARITASALLTQHAVACCNLLPAGESHYWWEGKLATSNEVVLIAKTTQAKTELARQILAENHPYDCPAILSFAADANADYMRWVEGVTSAHHSG